MMKLAIVAYIATGLAVMSMANQIAELRCLPRSPLYGEAFMISIWPLTLTVVATTQAPNHCTRR